VNLKSPSSSLEAQANKDVDNKKSATLILVLMGIIICLLLIIMSLLLSPPSPDTDPKKKLEIINNNKKEKKVIEEVSKPVIEEVSKKKPLSEIRKNNNQEQAVDLEKEKNEEVILKRKIEEETLEKKFNKNISEALSAIEKHQLTHAEKKLTEAKLLKANESIIKELKQRINTKRKEIIINKLIQDAQQEEKKEQWLRALNDYKKILSIDATINSIIVKKQRANTYLKLNIKLNKIIEKPERLNDDKALLNAKKLIQSVKLEIKGKQRLLYPLSTTPGLTRKISTADKIISEASIPIKVTIRSDNLTEISIYKVGNFGKLIEKKLTLRPGHYTIVGSRDGYRDFRKKLVITAADQSIVLNVMCKETI